MVNWSAMVGCWWVVCDGYSGVVLDVELRWFGVLGILPSGRLTVEPKVRPPLESKPCMPKIFLRKVP